MTDYLANLARRSAGLAPVARARTPPVASRLGPMAAVEAAPGPRPGSTSPRLLEGPASPVLPVAGQPPAVASGAVVEVRTGGPVARDWSARAPASLSPDGGRRTGTTVEDRPARPARGRSADHEIVPPEQGRQTPTPAREPALQMVTAVRDASGHGLVPTGRAVAAVGADARTSVGPQSSPASGSTAPPRPPAHPPVRPAEVAPTPAPRPEPRLAGAVTRADPARRVVNAEPVQRPPIGRLPHPDATPGRRIQVRIGTIEIHGDGTQAPQPVVVVPPPASAPIPVPAGSGFDDYVRLRTYAPWDR